MSAYTDPDRSTLSRALTATYGSEARRCSNKLTASLRKMALATCGLQFLLQCRRHHVYPKFSSDCLRLSQNGEHLTKLVRKLPGRILRAAICDSRQRVFETQWSVDFYWMSLHAIVKDSTLWDAFVSQKDSMYFQAVSAASLRLRRKFTALFTCPPNSAYSLLPALRQPASTSTSNVSSTYFSCQSSLLTEASAAPPCRSS